MYCNLLLGNFSKYLLKNLSNFVLHVNEQHVKNKQNNKSVFHFIQTFFLVFQLYRGTVKHKYVCAATRSHLCSIQSEVFLC